MVRCFPSIVMRKCSPARPYGLRYLFMDGSRGSQNPYSKKGDCLRSWLQPRRSSISLRRADARHERDRLQRREVQIEASINGNGCCRSLQTARPNDLSALRTLSFRRTERPLAERGPAGKEVPGVERAQPKVAARIDLSDSPDIG